MTGTDPATGALAGETIQEQTRQAIANCLAIREAGGIPRRGGAEDALRVSYLVAQVQRAGGFEGADQVELDVLGWEVVE